MAGRKVWAADDVLTAADVNSYLMDQAVMVFSSATTRDGAILSPDEGMLTYRTDANIYEFWNGSAWAALGGAIGTATNAAYAATATNAAYAATAGTATNASKVSNQTVFIQSSTPTANATNDLWFW